MREIIPKTDVVDDEKLKIDFKESVKKILKEKMPKIKIGNLELETSILESIYHFHPYFSKCEELFPLTKKEVVEILDPKERLSIMKNSAQVAQEIIKTLFSEERKENESENSILDGKCGTTSGVTQELMALSSVRSIIVHGTFPIQYIEDGKTQDHLYGRHWLYASTDGTIPTPDSTNKLLLIDPTRCQFDQDNQSVMSLNDKRYIPFNIPPDAHPAFIERAKDSFIQINKAIWTEEELNQWRMILT